MSINSRKLAKSLSLTWLVILILTVTSIMRVFASNALFVPNHHAHNLPLPATVVATPLLNNDSGSGDIVSTPRAPTLTGQNLNVQNITIDPAHPDVGTPVTITVVVRNSGSNAVTETFGLFLYVDPVEQPPISTTTPTDFTVWGLGLMT